jgi:hypothetical protein
MNYEDAKKTAAEVNGVYDTYNNALDLIEEAASKGKWSVNVPLYDMRDYRSKVMVRDMLEKLKYSAKFVGLDQYELEVSWWA